MKSIFSIAVLLSALCRGVLALPKPKSQTTKIDVSGIRMVNSSMEKARFRGLTLISNNNSNKNSNSGDDDNKDKKNKLFESHEIMSFAREHANVAAYIAIAYAVAMAVKCEYPNICIWPSNLFVVVGRDIVAVW